jgi:hypothetical protein
MILIGQRLTADSNNMHNMGLSMIKFGGGLSDEGGFLP